MRFPTSLLALAFLFPACRTLAPESGGAGRFAIVDPDDLLDDEAEAALRAEGESTLSRVAAEWGLDPPAKPVRVRIAAGLGRCFADESGITLDRGHIPLKDLSHELVHYLCGDSWRVASEGLATWFTEAFAEDRARPGYVTLDEKSLAYIECGLEADLSAAATRERLDPRGYVQAASFTGFLLRRYGTERVRALYEGPPDGYLAAFGRDRDALLDDWQEDLAARVAISSPRYAEFVRSVRLFLAGAGPDPEG